MTKKDKKCPVEKERSGEKRARLDKRNEKERARKEQKLKRKKYKACQKKE